MSHSPHRGNRIGPVDKQTIFSLFIAVWLGSTMMNGFNPLVGFVKIISDYMIPSLSGNASLIILVTLSGGMIAMLRNTGAAEAFATKVTKVINTAKKGQIVTCLSAFIFSYTEPCLMLGTIMRPVTDMVRISRAKLAYILDSMGCNLAALSPISSYGPFITGLIAAELLASGVEGNEWGIWLNMLPFNLYGVFAMISVLIVAAFGLNFGPMYKEEKRARETGKLLDDGVQPLVPEVKMSCPQIISLLCGTLLSLLFACLVLSLPPFSGPAIWLTTGWWDASAVPTLHLLFASPLWVARWVRASWV